MPSTDTCAAFTPVAEWKATSASPVTAPVEGEIIVPTALWTGSKMLLFYSNFDSAGPEQVTTYDACTDTWSAPTVSQTARSNPAARGLVGSTFVALGTVTHARLETDSMTWSQMNMQGGPVTADDLLNVTYLDDGLLVLGSTSTLRYDLAADTWRTLAAPPAGAFASGSQVTKLGASLLVWGATDASGNTSAIGVVYDIALDRWHPISSTGAPAPSFEPGSTTYGEDLYLWGGGPLFGGAIYNVASDSWRPMNVAGGGGPYEAIAWTGGKLYSFDAGYQPKGEVYDPAANVWTPIDMTGAPWPAEVWSSDTHLTRDGRVVLFWGADGSGVSGGVFDPAANEWTAVAGVGRDPNAQWLVTLFTGERLLEWGSYKNKSLGCPAPPEICEGDGVTEPVYTLTGQMYRP